jgi:hypothetical protein
MLDEGAMIDRREFLQIAGVAAGAVILPSQKLIVSSTRTIVDMGKNVPRTLQQHIDSLWRNGGGTLSVGGTFVVRRPVIVRSGVLVDGVVITSTIGPGIFDSRSMLPDGSIPVSGCFIVDAWSRVDRSVRGRAVRYYAWNGEVIEADGYGGKIGSCSRMDWSAIHGERGAVVPGFHSSCHPNLRVVAHTGMKLYRSRKRGV